VFKKELNLGIMENNFEFYFDSGMTGAENEIKYEKFVEHLESAIEHYNTNGCYIDENGKVYPHVFQDEVGTLITIEHFEPDLYLFDKSLKRLIKLNIDGYDDNKIFNVELFTTSFQSIVDFVDGDLLLGESQTKSEYIFNTKDVHLVKYCYKLIFDSAENNELEQVWDSWNTKM
jgi:hypothetical protein